MARHLKCSVTPRSPAFSAASSSSTSSSRSRRSRSGSVSGAVSVLSDGFHSLTDGASNVVALVGVRVARQPPDEDHPYGHRKFETLASVGILIFLVLVLVQVVSAASGAPAERRGADAWMPWRSG